ncbi:MAG: hypothetical protein RLZ14_1862, partial [Actinomycetota bacterium]
MPAPPNATPVAVGEHYEVASDTQLVVSAPGVLANDTDADGDAITASLVSVSSNGTADLAADGSFTYTPPPHFGGLFLISYRVFDGTAYSNTVTAAIDVRPPPPAVTGVSGSLNVDHDAVVSFTPISDVNFYGSISYTATCTSANGGATRTGTAATTPVIVSNLTPGTSYTCVVRGSNIAGPGEASAPTAALDVPAPPNVGVTQGVSGNAVVFEAPLGSTVTSFARLASVPAGTPSNVVLPEGLYSFRVAGTVVGEAVRFTFKYTPQPGVVVNGYLKYVGGSWVRLPSQLVDLSVAGQVTITIVDGGAYDDDGLANGIVVDPGAPAVITAGVPEAPSVVSLAIDDDRQAVIGYTPGWDGGLPITEYYAECHDLAGAGLFSGGAAITTLAMYVPNTVAGVSFNCTVQAKNALGWGPMSTASSTLVMPTTPGRASAVNLSQFANSIVVHFTQPAFLGFMPDITFLATCSSTDGGIVRSQTGTANPITVPNVIGGLSYVCSVVSGNSAGNGPVSAPVAPFAMGPTAPAAPSNVVAALVGTSSATVSFSPGPSGGSPITSYAASCTASGRPTITGTGPSGPISVSGLVAGASYSCTVTATNLFGTSAASAASAPLLVPTVPGAPTGVSGTRSVATAAVVSFVPPASNGGSPILSYRATCSSTGALDVSQTGASSPITVSGLLVTAAYTCRVVATNAVGDSLPSAATATLPGATVPGAPTSVSVTVDADRVAQIAFTAPVSNGGTVITSYSARCVPTAAGQATVTASGASSPIPVTGLAAGRTYNCSVTANNVVGASAAASAPAVTMPTTPGAPTGLTLTISAVRQGSVAFVPPVYVGTTAINQYSATCTTTTVG